MRAPILLLAPALLLGCGEKSAGDHVREAYENKAAAVDQQAARQPNETAKTIYESRAEALREEGKDRATGLEGGEPAASDHSSSASR